MALRRLKKMNPPTRKGIFDSFEIFTSNMNIPLRTGNISAEENCSGNLSRANPICVCAPVEKTCMWKLPIRLDSLSNTKRGTDIKRMGEGA